MIEEFLSQGRHKVRISVPKRGDKLSMLKLAQQDRLEMSKTISEKNRSKAEKQLQLRNEIKAALQEGNIDIEPRGESYRIESYDISNTNGIDSVGAMVVFEGTNKIRKELPKV